jgi:acetyl esterase/lipase
VYISRSRILLCVAAIACLTAFYYWHTLPYSRLPRDNSKPSSMMAPGGHRLLRPTFADLPYADRSPFEKLDLYLPAPSKRLAPLVIWIHGGAFTEGDKTSMPRSDFGPPRHDGTYQVQVPDVGLLTGKGYAVASLNYRLGFIMPTAAVPAISDGKAAVRFLRANAAKYSLDPGKFAAWGNSAGGFMAAMLGVTGDQPSPFDDPALGNSDVSSAVQAVVIWFGAANHLGRDVLSIPRYLPTAKVLPPFLMANGDADDVVSAENARKLNADLLAGGAKSTLTILPGAGHEDPAFMATQMGPTFIFLDRALGR